MRTLLPFDVWEAAQRRIRYLFDEFDHVSVNYSGGKDSTVLLGVTLDIARERGRLPLEVVWIDQEAEWNSTVELMRVVQAMDGVDLKWLQCPIQIFNATSGSDPWLWCWEEGREWLRDQEPDSIKVNPYGTTRFTELFGAFDAYHHPDETVARLTGVRAEESPGRSMGLTTHPCYKHITWGRVQDKKRGHYGLSPLYDWKYTDIWKAIHDHGWPYNDLYNVQYQHGVPVREMRVSSLHHETAIRSLWYLHEVDIDLWNRLSDRLSGVNSAKQMHTSFNKPPKKLPSMFKDWREYRDFLTDNLIEDPEIRAKFHHQHAQNDRWFIPEIHEELWKMHVSAILVNDYHGTKLQTFQAAHAMHRVGVGKSQTSKAWEEARAGSEAN